MAEESFEERIDRLADHFKEVLKKHKIDDPEKLDKALSDSDEIHNILKSNNISWERMRRLTNQDYLGTDLHDMNSRIRHKD